MLLEFHSVTPISVLANLVLVPLSFISLFTVVLSLITARLGLVALQVLFNNANWLLAHAMMTSATWFAAIPGGNFAVAFVCMIAYGMSNGLKAVQRSTLPLALFGRGQFGAYMGRLALPQGIVSAASPIVLASVLDRYGAAGVLWLNLVFGTISLVAMIMLARLARSVR